MGKGSGAGEGWGESDTKGGHGEWKHGLCGSCSPLGDCCLICWCAPIGNMLLADKMGLEGFEYKYLALGDYIGFGGLCTFISSMLVRQKVRERYGIPGSAGGDCIISCCCTVCSLCQMTKQVNDH